MCSWPRCGGSLGASAISRATLCDTVTDRVLDGNIDGSLFNTGCGSIACGVAMRLLLWATRRDRGHLAGPDVNMDGQGTAHGDVIGW